MARAEQPLVSIITPTFDRARYLPQTIDSLLALDYPRLEVVVIDDGSTDETPEILEQYAERDAGAGRFRWFRHPNLGQARSINRGFELAQGELIGVINSDDPQPPGLLSPLVEILVANPDVMLVYPDWEMVDEDGELIMTLRTLDYSFADLVRWHECIPGPGVLYRRALVDRVGGWDPAFRFCPDYDWFLRAGLVGEFRRVPVPLARWRHHPGSITAGQRGEAMAREMVAVTEKFFARADLPAEIQAVRGEAFRNAYVVAGIVVDHDANAPGDRFEIRDRLVKLHADRELRRQPTSRRPEVVNISLHQVVMEQAETITWLHAEAPSAIERPRGCTRRSPNAIGSSLACEAALAQPGGTTSSRAGHGAFWGEAECRAAE